MLILIGLVIEGSIQVRSVHGAPNQWIVKYATSVKTPSDFLQEEGEFSFTVPADSPYATSTAFKSTATGKVIYNLKTVYPPIEDAYQCTGKYNSQYTSSVSVSVIYNLSAQGIDSTPILHLYGISGTEPESVFYTWNCVTDDGSRTWQIKDIKADLPIVSLCRASNVIEIPLKDGSTFKEDYPDGYKCEVTIYGTANQKPVANAGPDQEVNAENVVTLDGSGSSDPDGDPITYSWRQIGGPTVQLSNPQSPNPTFTAPSPAPSETDGITTIRPASFIMNKGITFVSAESEVIKLIFQLTVNDGILSSLPSNVVITAVPTCTDPKKSKTDISLLPVKTLPFRAKDLRQADSETNKMFIIDGTKAKGKTTPTIDPIVTERNGKILCAYVKVEISTVVPNWTNLGDDPTNNCKSVLDEWKRVKGIIDVHEEKHRADLQKQVFLKEAHKSYLNMPATQTGAITAGLLNQAKISQDKLHGGIGHSVSINIDKMCDFEIPQ